MLENIDMQMYFIVTTTFIYAKCFCVIS